MSFLDDVSDVFVSGLNQAVDAEFSEPTPLADDRTYSNTDNGGVALDGWPNVQYISNSLPGASQMMMIGGGLLALLITLKITKVI